MPIFPILTYLLSQKINRYNPDKTIISSFAIAKNINIKSYKKLYLHSPMQYIWDMYDENISKLPIYKKFPYMIVTRYLRFWDKKYTKFDEIFFNSNFTKQLAYRLYNIFGIVKYPNINKIFLKTVSTQNPMNYYTYI
jgi:hypothetical protein